MQELFSDRLRFDRFTESHLQNFFSLENDPAVMSFYRRKYSATVEDSLPFFRLYMDYMARNPNYGGYSVFDRVSGKFIGIAVIIHIELKEENKDIEIGYRLHKKFWGHGYATEMARTMLNYGFYTLGHTELYGTTNPEHQVSQHILKKIGMKEIGPATHYAGSTLFKISV